MSFKNDVIILGVYLSQQTTSKLGENKPLYFNPNRFVTEIESTTEHFSLPEKFSQSLKSSSDVVAEGASTY